MDTISNKDRSAATTSAISSIIEMNGHSMDSYQADPKTKQNQQPLLPTSRTTLEDATPAKNDDDRDQRRRQQQSMFSYLLSKEGGQCLNKRRLPPSPTAHPILNRTSSHPIRKYQPHIPKRSASISTKSTLDIFLQRQPFALPGNHKTVKKMPSYDRFIPIRRSMTLACSQFNLANDTSLKDLDLDTLNYKKRVAQALGFKHNDRILHFTPPPPTVPPGRRQLTKQHWYALDDRLAPSLSSRYNHASSQQQNEEEQEQQRHIATVPERILDAPDMKDDFYLNVLDWSCQNMVAIGLDCSVYIWNADNGKVQALNYTGNDVVTSLSWSGDGNFLSLGIDSGDIQIWDTETNTKLRTMTGRQCRVGVVAWEKHTLSSGAKNGSIWQHDVRVVKHKTAELVKHEDEVCGLKWSPDGTHLASGGNDNLVCVWDARKTSKPVISKEIHRGAVKALAWCPWNHKILASSGGREDKRIHFWNTKSAITIKTVNTNAQTTSLQWSRHYKEIVSTHGYPRNNISVWSYPKLQRLVDFPGHDSKILGSSLSPDGQVLATAAADENLKFWRLFEHDGSRQLLLPKDEMQRSNLIRKSASLR